MQIKKITNDAITIKINVVRENVKHQNNLFYTA